MGCFVYMYNVLNIKMKILVLKTVYLMGFISKIKIVRERPPYSTVKSPGLSKGHG